MVNPPLLAIQPSNHPLIYYSSHPLGLYCCDFRMQKATAIGQRQVPPSSFCRVPDDAYHYLVSRSGSLEVIDIRNPDVPELRWRYEGTLHSLRCLHTSSGEDSSYHILPPLLAPPSPTRRLSNNTRRRLANPRHRLRPLCRGQHMGRLGGYHTNAGRLSHQRQLTAGQHPHIHAAQR